MKDVDNRPYFALILLDSNAAGLCIALSNELDSTLSGRKTERKTHPVKHHAVCKVANETFLS
jgi:hypothetical protein